MSGARTSAAGAADMQLELMSELFADERKSVADASTWFEAALRKSDKLKEDDVSTAAKVVRDMVNVEETRLAATGVRLVAARDSLTAYSLAKLGDGPRSTTIQAVPKADEDDVAEKQEKKDKKLRSQEEAASAQGRLARQKRYHPVHLSGQAPPVPTPNRHVF